MLFIFAVALSIANPVGWVDASKPTIGGLPLFVVGFAASTHPTSDPPAAATAPPAKPTDNTPRTTDNSKPVWTPKDKETVVLLGSAFIEQEARDGYLETELIRLFPNKDIRVRNLGWSGDTVHCQARSYFGPPQEGFDRLREHLKMIKPTTVICCYGANESWKGETGIPDFRKGYEKLIDMIREATGATVVLMTPPKYDSIQYPGAPPLPWKDQLQTANDRLSRYVQEIKYVADARKAAFWPWSDEIYPMTWHGVDWKPEGYEYLAKKLFEQAPPVHRIVTIDAGFSRAEAYGGEISEVAKRGSGLTWSLRLNILPKPGPQRSMLGMADEAPMNLMLEPGSEGRAIVTLRIDDVPIIVEKPFAKSSMPFPRTAPDYRQSELLRLAIVKKNALFFHRWRPANETYLYGFRKHEQGNNGVEPPQFDKLVEEAEAEIAKLKKPVPHKYELIRVEEKK